MVPFDTTKKRFRNQFESLNALKRIWGKAPDFSDFLTITCCRSISLQNFAQRQQCYLTLEYLSQWASFKIWNWTWQLPTAKKLEGRTSLREKFSHIFPILRRIPTWFPSLSLESWPIFDDLTHSKKFKIYLSARISKETVSDCRSSEASKETDQAVANRVVVAKKEPGLENILSWLFIVLISSQNLVFVPLLPPLVPPRLPPLHGLNTWFWSILISDTGRES